MLPTPFDTSVHFRALRVASSGTPLQGYEAIAGRWSSPARLAQFYSGRRAATQCLHELGCSAETIISADDHRCPVWPEGLVGSISHTATWSAAAVTRQSHARSIGLDLEDATRKVAESLSARVALPEEQNILQASDLENPLLLLFSIKEACYKALYPLCHEVLNFPDLCVTRIGEDRFRAELQRTVGALAKGTTCDVRAFVREGVIISGAIPSSFR